MEELENFLLSNFSKKNNFAEWRYIQMLFQNEQNKHPKNKGRNTLKYLIQADTRLEFVINDTLRDRIIVPSFNEDDIFAFLFQYFEVIGNNATTNPQKTKKMETYVTQERIESLIDKVSYHHEDNKASVCFITLKNGFIVTGISGVVDKTNFNKEMGEKYAYQNAFNKIWELEGYRLQWEICEKL